MNKNIFLAPKEGFEISFFPKVSAKILQTNRSGYRLCRGSAFYYSGQAI
jgi:hypothetical protein